MRCPDFRTMVLIAVVSISAVARAADQPNVVFVITDDQGYGDIAAHGNTMIRTPAMDRLHAQSLRLTNFHVDPTCSPTRSALLTGRYSTRTGVWHTIQGRSLMSPDEVTLAEVFAANGYRTGMFGKWHLGDNAPLRPQDQGFQKAVHLRGGGITQSPDWWGNDYFDDVFLHEDGTPEQFTGYCTDVFFREALKFIGQAKSDSSPFFCYLATNAPHSPYFVDDEYSRPYREAGVPAEMAAFYGMVTNIDENLGRLMDKLAEWKLADDTVLIFMTDNGTAAGMARRNDKESWKGFNAGMRGAKGSEYDGGHRVPFFIRWPGGKFQGGRDFHQLTAHIDVLPTLVELCGLKKPDGPPIDGISLVPLLKGGADSVPDRTLFVHSQRIEHPEKGRKCEVLTQQWRLVNNKELYDIPRDPGQVSDVASAHADVVQKLNAAYDDWWGSLSPVFDDFVRIDLGSDAQNPTQLCCHDWHKEDNSRIPVMQTEVASDPLQNGFWAVNVTRPGTYEFTLRMRPAGVIHSLPPGTARLQLGNVQASAPIQPGDIKAVIRKELPAGPAMLQTWLEGANGESRGAYYVDVKRVD